MSVRRKGRAARPAEGSYPALRAFCRGYLHEDVIAEHGSVTAAVDAFRAEATPAERRALASDWRRFVADTRGQDIGELGSQLAGRLGAKWVPETVADLQALADAILAPARIE